MNNEKLKSFCRDIGLKCVGIAGGGPYDNLEKIIKNMKELCKILNHLFMYMLRRQNK